MLKLNQIHCVDALAGLKQLPDESVDCVLTSPPYWALRDYGTTPLIWDGDPKCHHDFEPERQVRLTAEKDRESETKKISGKSHRSTSSNEPIESAFCKKCHAWSGSLGLEPTPNLFLVHLVSIFDEVRRVLKHSGTLWVNIGDGYAGSWGNYGRRIDDNRGDRSSSKSRWRRNADDHEFRPPSSYAQAVPPKSLCLTPARFMIAMVERGWILRNDIVWHKPNHMPTSVKDRLACSWEHVLFFSKAKRYYFDLDAIRVPHVTKGTRLFRPGKHARARDSPHLRGNRMPPSMHERNGLHPGGRNPGDYWTVLSETRPIRHDICGSHVPTVPVNTTWSNFENSGLSDCWDIATKGFKGAHFAVYPEKLCERPILAGCPTEVCAKCGVPPAMAKMFRRAGKQRTRAKETERRNSCSCRVPTIPGVVLDPFAGAGTTCVVAKRLGRRFIGLEMNPDYVAMARERLLIAGH